MPRFRYSGAPVFLVEFERRVEHGDIVEGPDSLGCNHGFTLIDEKAEKQVAAGPARPKSERKHAGGED